MALTADAVRLLTPENAARFIRRATLKTGSPLYDEDLVQDVLLAGVLAFRRLEVRAPRAFFAKIVRNAVADHWRRRPYSIQLDTIDPT